MGSDLQMMQSPLTPVTGIHGAAVINLIRVVDGAGSAPKVKGFEPVGERCPSISHTTAAPCTTAVIPSLCGVKSFFRPGTINAYAAGTALMVASISLQPTTSACDHPGRWSECIFRQARICVIDEFLVPELSQRHWKTASQARAKMRPVEALTILVPSAEKSHFPEQRLRGGLELLLLCGL